jgi:hypothetical protein
MLVRLEFEEPGLEPQKEEMLKPEANACKPIPLVSNGELAAPTNDINTTVALSLLIQLLTSTQVSKRIRLLQTLCVTSRNYQLTF